MSSKESTIASFIESAPPGELANVVNDIKALGWTGPLDAAFKKYNEEQFVVVKVNEEGVIVSGYNALEGGRYFDSKRGLGFGVDHAGQKTSDVQSHTLDTPHADLISSLIKSFTTAAAEHFPSSTIGVYPHEGKVAIVLVANKYSPQNFWNGRWRSEYILDPSSGALKGEVKVDVHYYEDGNVRMSTRRKVEGSAQGADAAVKEISKQENKFQEELNRAFTTLAEGSFKGLRRPLPVTRQKVEWEKIGGYRLGQDIGGGRSK